MGAYYLESVANLVGQGIRGHLFEGVEAGHPEFGAIPPYRTAPIAVQSGTPTEHGTNAAGLLFAQGLQVKGVLPLGQMLYTSFSGVNRFALTQELVDPQKPYQAMLQTASWGGAVTTSYTSVSADLDNALFHADLFYTNSHGNTGNRASRPEAWAKNCAGIGGFVHFNNFNPQDDCWCGTASVGPAEDGRVGVSFTSYHDGVSTTSGTAGYTTFVGTSAATPVVAGAAGLAMQIFGEGYLGYPSVPWQSRFGAKPHLTTTRVMLAISSRQLRFNLAGRYEQGWGFPNPGDLYDLRDEVLVLDEEDVLQQGQSRTYLVWVKPGTPELRASMHHLEPQAAPFAIPHRVNSLDLQVVSPLGAVYFGNDAGLLAGPYSSGGGGPNDVDVHENVFLQSPVAGVYQVTVGATAVRQDSHLETAAVDADFALAVRGIGGGRDRSGMLLDLISTRPGELEVSLTRVPAGWAAGYTLLSADTRRHPSLGNVFGLEADALTLGLLGVQPGPGNVFAFTATTDPTLYPNATYRFPPPVATVLQGFTLDGVAFVLDLAGQIAAVSNVDRVTIR
jgi:hypothetical protein